LASKTDNNVVSKDSQIGYRSAEAPGCEPYACFVQRKEQIAAWLRAGYSVKAGRLLGQGRLERLSTRHAPIRGLVSDVLAVLPNA